MILHYLLYNVLLKFVRCDRVVSDPSPSNSNTACVLANARSESLQFRIYRALGHSGIVARKQDIVKTSLRRCRLRSHLRPDLRRAGVTKVFERCGGTVE